MPEVLVAIDRPFPGLRTFEPIESLLFLDAGFPFLAVAAASMRGIFAAEGIGLALRHA